MMLELLHLGETTSSLKEIKFYFSREITFLSKLIISSKQSKPSQSVTWCWCQQRRRMSLKMDHSAARDRLSLEYLETDSIGKLSSQSTRERHTSEVMSVRKMQQLQSISSQYYSTPSQLRQTSATQEIT